MGTLAVGLFAKGSLAGGSAGLFYGGGVEQLARQALGAAVVLVFGFVVTWLLARAIDATIGLRVDEAAERNGIDLGEHAENGYDLSRVQYSRYSRSIRVPSPVVETDSQEAEATA